MAKYITQKELAEILSMTRQYIGKLVRQGVFDGCFEGKKLDKDCALEAYFLFKNSSRRQKTSQSEVVIGNELEELLAAASSPLHKVQIQKDYWAAKLNEFKYEVEKGKYYPKEEIDKKAEKIIIAARNKALALPTKLAPQLISIDDVNEMQETLEKAIYEFLMELSRLGNELV